jgi:A/G-specific adenine glycosylase
MPKDTISSFQNKIRDYYNKYARQMPWRETSDPYHIVVSEIMLQQTQVPRVIEKYRAFIEKFPSWNSLSQASFAEVLEMWNGLGYNRRAKYLQMIAQKVVHEFRGTLPDDPAVLETFPGIGKATAASIVVYAFNKPIPFIETNIRRIYIHNFFNGKGNIHDNEIMPLVEETMDHNNPREWYWALMDYGTYLATQVPNPNRKSKHYTKQSKFEGSVRKVRGEILRQLLEKPCTKKWFYEIGDKTKVDNAINGLIKDDLIYQINRVFFLKN